MIKIAKENSIYEMSNKHKPVKKVELSDKVVFETHDCYTGDLKSSDQPPSMVPWDRINPATGPLYINGSEKGDLLVVNIEKITIASTAVMATLPDLGVMGDELNKELTSILNIDDDELIFNENIRIPIRPMIGVIGTAPKTDSVPCGTPDEHGGNMDCKEIVEGVKLYLPVFHDGALLSLGDVHAVMADGEVSVTGAEVDAEVTLTFDVIKGGQSYLPYPLLENNDKVILIHSEETVEQAIKEGVKKSIGFLNENYNIEKEEALRLLSLVGDVRICQVVDPLMTIRIELSKSILNQAESKIDLFK